MRRVKYKLTNTVVINPNLNENEFYKRNEQYSLLDKTDFSKDRHIYQFNPVKINLKGRDYLIQFNFCDDPLCKWFGTEQVEYRNPNRRNNFIKAIKELGLEEQLALLQPNKAA